MLHKKLAYLHDKPLTAGIVEKPGDYLYGIAMNYYELPGLIDKTSNDYNRQII
jgi:hypothetical protein